MGTDSDFFFVGFGCFNKWGRSPICWVGHSLFEIYISSYISLSAASPRLHYLSLM
jgi:hypothetical protein